MYLSTTFITPVLFLLFVTTPASSSGIHIQLAKHSQVHKNEGIVDREVLRRSVDNSIRKYSNRNQAQKTGHLHNSSSESKHHNTQTTRIGSEPLIFGQFVWYGNLSIGKPPQNLKVVFDTGSADVLLSSTACNTCKGHNLYDPSKSYTARDLGQPYYETFGDGSHFNGTLYTDNVNVAGYTARNQTLAAATYTSGVINSPNFPPDGILGMAFQNNSVSNSTPFFQTLVTQGSLTENIFAFYLAKEGSELYLGGTNDKLYKGNITYVPVTKEGYWETSFQAMYFNQQEVAGVTDAIIDTGTSLIIGDNRTVQAFYDKIPGSALNDSTGIYQIPCSFNDSISFEFGSKNFSVPFNLGPISENSTTCVGGLIGGSRMWIIGDVFLANVYSVFDVGNKQVGFAELN